MIYRDTILYVLQGDERKKHAITVDMVLLSQVQ